MSKNDFVALLKFEMSRGSIPVLDEEQMDALYKKYVKNLEKDDYYNSIGDKESDAAYSYRDDMFSDLIATIA